jgi:hypothetical protein
MNLLKNVNQLSIRGFLVRKLHISKTFVGCDLLPENWTNGGWRDLTGEVPKKGPNGEAKAA